MLFRVPLVAYLLLTGFYCQAQDKVYTFDYLLEYDCTYYHYDTPENGKVSKNFKIYYYINSKDNSYKAELREIDSLDMYMTFREENGNSAHVHFAKKDILNVDVFKILCNNVAHYNYPHSRLTRLYDFTKDKDTIVADKQYGIYTFSVKDPKKRIRKKLSNTTYVIDENIKSHRPLFPYSLNYEIWKKNQITNGMTVDYKVYNDSDQLSVNFTLVTYRKVTKKVVIPAACNSSSK